jgi:hypothetical protein
VNRFILLSFLVMGWTYYELSGGAAFVPETRPQLMAEAEVEAPAVTEDVPVVEVVTRADTETLDALPEDLPPTPEAIALAPEVAETVAPSVDAAVEAALQEPAPEVASSGLDLREVTGDRVNMRTGPGTDYSVVDRLGQGSVIIVLETGADGWVRVEVERSGLTGWMSDQFLAGIDG